MDSKLKSTLSRIQQEKDRGNHAKAAKRATDALEKYPDSPDLYREAIDALLEAGESLQAIVLLKQAFKRLPDERAGLTDAVRDRVCTLGDAVVGKFILEDSVRQRDLRSARTLVGHFNDRTVRDLLQRTRMKRSSLAAAAHGGHSVGDELMTNILSDAVLSARLDRPDEAAAAAADVLDRNADEGESLAPLLEDVVEAHPDSAPLRYVLARCWNSAGRYADATGCLVDAVTHDAALAGDALDLLTATAEGFGENDVPEVMGRGMLKLMLIDGRFDRAAELARPWLGREGMAEYLAATIAPHLSDAGELSDLHLLALDASVSADRMGTVHQILDTVAGHDGNRDRVLEWIDAQGELALPADIMLLQARLLIAAERYDDAERTLKAVCVASRAELPRVIALLDEHRDRSTGLDALYHDISATDEATATPEPESSAGDFELEAASPPRAAASDDGDDFQVFETSEFQFGAAGDSDEPLVTQEDTSPPALGDVGEDSEFDIYDGTNILGGDSGPRPTAPQAASYTGTRRPLDNDTAGIVWDEEGDDSAPLPPAPAPAEPEVEARVEPEVPGATEEHVHNVANGLYLSGAKTFFHVEDTVNAPRPPGPEPEAAAPDPQPEMEPEPDATVEAEAEPEAESQPEPEPDVEALPPEPPTFAQRFARFKDGTLDDDDVLELLAEAVAEQRMDELGQLLGTNGDSEAHAVAWGLAGAEYELMSGHPGRALERLEALRERDMSDTERKDMWLKTVACQRMRRDLDAAHTTLTQLLELYPDCQEVAQLARQNYREYLQNQCADAPVLEKMTSLDGDE